MVADLTIVVEASALTTEALTWPERARAAVVVDDAGYSVAGELLLGIKALRQHIAETFDPHIKRAHEAHAALCRDKRLAEAPLTEAERIIKDALSTYARAKEAQRLVEERRLAEQARAAEEIRRLEEAAALEREAMATDNPDLLREAQQLVAEPVTVAPITVASSTPKVTGIVHRENWSARVVDLQKLIRWVATHPEHVNLLQPNVTALNSLARSMKQHLAIDGVVVVKTATVAAGGR
jgi:hypothetical protein